MDNVSAVIITRDEEASIARCLASLQWVHEVVVVDSGSVDETCRICRDAGCRVVSKTEWEGFGLQKRFAVEQAANNWIFSIDADEVVTPELAREVLDALREPAYAGYRVRRTSFYQGRRVRHCGWDRDFPLRLFDRRQGTFNKRTVHESVRLPGAKGTLAGALLHYTYPTAADHYRKMEAYARMGAELLHRRGYRPYHGEAALRAAGKFLKMYLLQAGMLDGMTGLLLSARSSYGVYRKYDALWKLLK